MATTAERQVSAVCASPAIGLDRSDVHVWTVRLEVHEPVISRLTAVLSAQERHAAGRLRFARHRRRFIVRRAALRAVLSQYVDQTPSQLTFNHNAYGKPSLTQQSSPHEIQFNASHSGELALVAVARARRLGIDIEQVNPAIQVEELTSHVFPSEVASKILALPSKQRVEEFYRCWTATEARLKAVGVGLTGERLPFNANSSLYEPTKSALVGTDIRKHDEWSTKQLDVGARHAATLVVEGSEWKLSRWCHWEPPGGPAF